MRGLKKLGDRMSRGLGNLLARAVLSGLAKQEGLQVLQLKVLAGEVKDGVELFEPYGHTGVALDGAESVVAFMDGSRTHAIALVQTDRRYRPKDLQPGETCHYGRDGQRVVMRNGGKVEVEAATEVKITTTKVKLIADVDIIGNTTFSGTVTANGKRIDQTHTHTLAGGGTTLVVT